MSMNEMMKMNSIVKRISLFISITLFMLLATSAVAEDDINPNAEVNVTVNTPEYVFNTFEVTIDVVEVSDICSAQFEIIFDPDVINVENVKSDVECGMIDDTEMPKPACRLMDDDRIRVVIYDAKLVGEGGLSGSGYLAKITFEVVGDIGDTSTIDISDEISDTFRRKLCYAEVDYDDELHRAQPCEMSANWFGTNVTIGTAPSMPAETPTPTEAPTIAAILIPTPSVTPIETPSLDLSSNPSTPTTSAQGAESGAVPAAPSKKDGLQDLFTTHNFIAIYSLIGLFAFIYALTLLKW